MHMSKYVIYLTNPEDQASAAGLSYSSGRYGFGLRAESLDAAIDGAIARCRADGIYGLDWSARIVRLTDLGLPSTAYADEAVVCMLDEMTPSPWYPEAKPLAGGGVRLW